MVPSPGQSDNRADRSPPATGNVIPARAHYRPKRNPLTPAQPTIKSHTIRLLIATAIGSALMLVLLMLAVKYAQRDWSQKNQRAWESAQARIAAHAASNAPAADAIAPASQPYTLRPAATRRYLEGLSGDSRIQNLWLILARGLSDLSHPDLLVSCLHMAMASSGENEAIKNDLGVAYLQQQRLKEAYRQFRAAEQIRPGFPPTRFNLALCAISDRNPAYATRLLGQYLGLRPADTTALRLQAHLLSQLGRPEEALRMLEKFLKHQPPDQPLFLDAAGLAARLGQHGNALRYLDTAMNGNSIQTVAKMYQSTAFRDIRLSGEGDALATRIANKARAAFAAPVATDEIQPLRATVPDAKIR